MKYRIDLHCHSRFSSDGVSEPEEMVQAARERGLHGFAITDHNTCACVDYFLSAGLMREDGHPVNDFLILPGQEITTSAGHLLALGVRLPDLKGIGPAEAVGLIKEAGGYATDVGNGDPLETSAIVAGNQYMHALLRPIVAEGMLPPA